MFGKVFVVFQELFVVFADMGHRILRLQKEVIGSGVENTFKNDEKEDSGHDENNFFFYSIFSFTTFL